MKNPLFQEARQAVNSAKQAFASNKSDHKSIEKAKNAMSSAYANSNVEEQKQLHSLQDELDQLQ